MIKNNNPKKLFDFSLYPDALEYLEKQPNMTKYLVDLIRKDMTSAIDINKESIFEIIEEYLEMKKISPIEIKQDQEEKDEVDDNKLKNAALKIMGKV